MIPYFDLKAVTAQYRDELIEDFARVLDSGWFIRGAEVGAFETEFARYCGTRHCVGVGNGVFVGPNATFTNDTFPRSRQRPDAWARTVIKDGASIGANATLLPGITIGERAMIGAGAVVLKSVGPGEVVVGNPARVIRSIE